MDDTNALECTLESALAFDLWLYHAELQCLAFRVLTKCKRRRYVAC